MSHNGFDIIVRSLLLDKLLPRRYFVVYQAVLINLPRLYIIHVLMYQVPVGDQFHVFDHFVRRCIDLEIGCSVPFKCY